MELVGNSALASCPCHGAAQSEEVAAAWKKYRSRLYYDKNRDVLLAKRRAAYRKNEKDSPESRRDAPSSLANHPDSAKGLTRTRHISPAKGMTSIRRHYNMDRIVNNDNRGGVQAELLSSLKPEPAVYLVIDMNLSLIHI